MKTSEDIRKVPNISRRRSKISQNYQRLPKMDQIILDHYFCASLDRNTYPSENDTKNRDSAPLTDYPLPMTSSGNLLLLNQDKAHRLKVLFSIISFAVCFVSTSCQVLGKSSHAKTDPRITRIAVILAVAKDTDSCSCRTVGVGTGRIKPLPVTVGLQGGRRSNQRLPCVTTQ